MAFLSRDDHGADDAPLWLRFTLTERGGVIGFDIPIAEPLLYGQLFQVLQRGRDRERVVLRRNGRRTRMLADHSREPADDSSRLQFLRPFDAG